MANFERMASIKGTAKAVVTAPVGFWKGFTFPFKGMRFVYFQHPGTSRIWILPIFVTLICCCGGTTSAWEYSGSLLEYVWETPTDDSVAAGISRIGHVIVEYILKVIFTALAIVIVTLLSSVIAAPFNGALSEEVERLAAGLKPNPGGIGTMVRDVARTIALEFRKFGLYLMVMIPLFLVQFAVPGIGTVIYSAFAFFFTAWFFGLDYVDWPAERRGWTPGERLRHARQNFMPMFGFGCGVWLFLFVPLLNLLFMPAAVAGGTLLFLEIHGAENDLGENVRVE